MVGASRALTSFFGGRGFSVRKNCALARLAEANKTNASTIAFNGMNGFKILRSLFLGKGLIFREARVRRSRKSAKEETPRT